MNFICLVCGFDGLSEPPYDEYESPSYEICPCCGFEFGFDDLDQGIVLLNIEKSGANWFSSSEKPDKWSLEEQLKNIE